MTTIYDVAKAAGVTAATVSYVLSGKGSVSDVTRERVMKHAQELDYRPNQIARSLSKQRTKTIGLVVPNISNPFYAGIAKAAECITYASGFRIFVTSTYRDEYLAQKLLDDLLSRRVDGIIIVSEIPSLLKALPSYSTSAVPLPIVFCLWEEGEPDFASVVAFDFYTAGCLAAQHLLELGHRHIAVVVDGISHDGVVIEKVHHSARLAGFQETLVQAGYPLDLSLLRIGNSSLESGKKAAYHLLQLPMPPSAIFATNDLMALGVISAAWELGIGVPYELSVVGFDDINLAAYFVPPLTTIILRENTIAEYAMDLLFHMIDGQQGVSPPMLQPKLVIRGSTAPLPTTSIHTVDL